MIQKTTNLYVLDNTTPIFVRCIHVYNMKHIGKICDLILVSVKRSVQRVKQSRRIKFITQGSKILAVIVHCTKKNIRFDGTSLKFSKNRCILLSKQKAILGTRITGPLPFEMLKFKQYARAITLAPFLV